MQKFIHPIKDADYRKLIGVPQSVLKGFKRCAAYVKYLEEQAQKPPTPAMILGHLVEQRLFDTSFQYELSPYPDFRSKEAKEWRDSRVHPIVTAEQWDKSEAMLKSLRSDADIMRLLEKGRSSMALTGIHKQTGLAQKALIDFAPDNRPFICDLKCLHNETPWGFGRAVSDFRYDIQAVRYTSLWQDVFNEDRTFVFIVVSSKEPYLCMPYRIPKEVLNDARHWHDEWMRRYAACAESGVWPKYGSGIVECHVPKWINAEDNWEEVVEG